MTATRHANGREITDLMRGPGFSGAVFFATQGEPGGGYAVGPDGPPTNLPLVAVVAECEVPGIGMLAILFDGLFLTARRGPRPGEVEHVLDAAIATGKCRYATERVDFTSALPPPAAVEALPRQERGRSRKGGGFAIWNFWM